VRSITFAALAFALLAPAARTEEEPEGWPREFTNEEGAVLTIYQPQIEEWKSYRRISARVAFTIRMPGDKEETIGAAEFAVNTQTDHDERTVTLDNLEISTMTLPSIEDKGAAAKAETAVRALFPDGPTTISLDRVLSNLDHGRVTPEQVIVENAPPRIIVSHEEAILVLVAGNAVFEPVERGAELITILNTASTVLRDTKSRKYYLLYEEGWLGASQLSGPWTPVKKLPEAFDAIPDNEEWKDVRAKIPGKPLPADQVPRIFGSTVPAELIVIYGKPQFGAVPGTNLKYVLNTESDLFVSDDDQYYFLVSGRWFRTSNLEGTWTFCTHELPEDFSKIPENHETGRVLVSVPGTQQAEESRITTQIPHMAKAERATTTLEVTYDGTPQFKRVQGSQNVSYVTNTSLDVFQVGERFYCCNDGIWFFATAVEGPWQVCDDVPEEIYTIPVRSPKYHVTFVRVYEATPEIVCFGYTSGYMGVYAADDVVVWGTGYRANRRLRYWRHHYRWRTAHPRHRDRHLRRAHRRTYGHARHYDHRTGRYERSHRARNHHAAKTKARGSYRSWDKGVKRATGRKPAAAKKKRGKPVSKKKDLYAGRDGQVYRKKGDSYQRQGKKGKTASAKRNKDLERDSRARSQGSQRKSQHKTYQKSRSSKSKSSRRGGGGRRR